MRGPTDFPFRTLRSGFLGMLMAVLLAASWTAPARAHESSLANGVFICHHDPGIAFSLPSEGWCEHYVDGYKIESCEEQHPSIMTTDERVWFLLSAFPDTKRWCGTEFGFGAYDADLFRFTSWGPCTPGENLELPTDHWPGPLAGTAVVTTDQPWQGNFEPVYYFAGYAYQGYPGQIPIDIDPATGFVGWGNCLTPPGSYEVTCLPAMGVMTEGDTCCPGVDVNICCVGEDCLLYSEQECLAAGGEWHPEWVTDCGPPNPCEYERNVCCVEEECYIATEQECIDLQGEWHPEWDACDPNPCLAPRHVCCVSWDCYLYTEQECTNADGEWHPEWDACSPNPCPENVCCVGEDCYITNAQECDDLQGEYHYGWHSCDPNPCEYDRRACCVYDDCHITTYPECIDMGGHWHVAWESCDPNPCLELHFVCCIGADCYVTNQNECEDMGGDWHPAWDSCEPNPCALLEEDRLADGVFICHHDPGIAFSLPPEGWCQHYVDGYKIESCDEQNPSIITTEERVWFVLSAFPDIKRWCGTEFGFGAYDADLFRFTSWGPCTPGENLEIPTAYWPGPLAGTAVVTIDQPWHGNFEPVYYFTGYVHEGFPGQIPLSVDPQTGFAGWGNCQALPDAYEATCLPALGVMTEGDECCPGVSGGICCVGEECLVYSQQECLDAGGDWHPEWSDCSPNPCLGVEGVCCVGEECYVTGQQQCHDMGGEWHPEWNACDPNPCGSPAVCCLGGDCYVTTEDECGHFGGTWHPEWDGCDPNPCPIPLAVCCVDVACYITTEQECTDMQGDWHPNWDSCVPNPCLPNDATDLTGGVFVCHHDPSIVYSLPEEDWCEHYLEGYKIESCEEQNPSIMTTEERVWFVLSAFPGTKEWCGTEFGFGDYDPDLFPFTGWGSCSPGEYLEIDSGGWPGPGEGTAIVATGLPWYGHLEPVYYFTGYVNQDFPGQIPLSVDPQTGFAGWGNCLTPPEPFECACFPAMGMMTDGVECYPEPPRFVCCVGEDCYIFTQDECDDAGGELHSEFADCGPPNPCVPPHYGVCCIGEDCYVTTEEECEAMAGEWHPDWPGCGDRNPCASLRVCCVCEECHLTSDYECYLLGGEWHSEWDTCDPNPCPAVPVQFVADVSIRQEEFEVVLRWHSVSDPRVTEFRVLRASGLDGIGEFLARVSPSAVPEHVYRDVTVAPRETYRYWVEALLGDGSTYSFGPWSITVVGSMRPLLLGISPNPLLQQTTIRFYLPGMSDARLEVYAANGRLVYAQLADALGPGVHRFVWDGRDLTGRELAGGVYWVCLQAGYPVGSEKIVIVR